MYLPSSTASFRDREASLSPSSAIADMFNLNFRGFRDSLARHNSPERDRPVRHFNPFQGQSGVDVSSTNFGDGLALLQPLFDGLDDAGDGSTRAADLRQELAGGAHEERHDVSDRLFPGRVLAELGHAGLALE